MGKRLPEPKWCVQVLTADKQWVTVGRYYHEGDAEFMKRRLINLSYRWPKYMSVEERRRRLRVYKSGELKCLQQ